MGKNKIPQENDEATKLLLTSARYQYRLDNNKGTVNPSSTMPPNSRDVEDIGGPSGSTLKRTNDPEQKCEPPNKKATFAKEVEQPPQSQDPGQSRSEGETKSTPTAETTNLVSIQLGQQRGDSASQEAENYDASTSQPPTDANVQLTLSPRDSTHSLDLATDVQAYVQENIGQFSITHNSYAANGPASNIANFLVGGQNYEELSPSGWYIIDMESSPPTGNNGNQNDGGSEYGDDVFPVIVLESDDEYPEIFNEYL